MYKVIISHPLVEEGMKMLSEKAEVYIANAAKASDYYEQLKDADAVILRLSSFDRDAFEHAPNLKVIGRTGVGFDAVDINAANEYGVPVVITPGANALSVAEHAVAMAFALSKNLVEYHNETVKGNYGIRNSGKAFELAGKVIGFVGFGAIGKLAANIFKAIGMTVMVYDPYVKKENIIEMGYEYISNLDDMYAVSDFITIHVPLTNETKGMFNLETFKKMKSTAFLINCARGPIVNEKDLVYALNNGIIAGAGLDVTENEPIKHDDEILNAKNVILSPHSAAQTKEAVIKMAQMCVQGVFDVLEGKRITNVASRDVYKHEKWKD